MAIGPVRFYLHCLFLAIALALSCSKPVPPEYSPTSFRSSIERLIDEGAFTCATALLRATDPRLLANAAMDTQDLTFFMIAEDTIFAPGIEYESYGQLENTKAWEMPGTSDALKSRAQADWHEAATRFAEKYNRAIVAQLSRDTTNGTE